MFPSLKFNDIKVFLQQQKSYICNGQKTKFWFNFAMKRLNIKHNALLIRWKISLNDEERNR